MLTGQNENGFGYRKLNKDRSENKKDARILDKRFRSIDPQLHDRGCEEQQGDHEIFCRLRLLTAEDQERQPRNERGENNHFDVTRNFQTAEQFVPGASAPCLFRSKPAAEEASAS